MINTNNGEVYAPFIQGRGGIQQARTLQGVLSGQLSNEEVSALKGLQEQFLASVDSAKGDNGIVSGTERVELHKQLNQMSRQLYALKHNDEVDAV